MRVLLINPIFRLPIDTRTTAHLGLAYLGAMYRKTYRHFYLRPSPIVRRLKTSDFWFNLPRNARIALRTFLPKKEKRGLLAETPLSCLSVEGEDRA